MITLRSVLTVFALFLLLFIKNSSADTWAYAPVKKDRVETFGDTKITLTIDARKNRQYPDFIVTIYGKTELLAKYRGISFDKIFSSQDKKYFVGLSNSGLPGTAVVLFDQKGSLLLEVKHRMATFDYCEETATLTRTWFDEKRPEVKFIADEQYGGIKSISLRDCRGNTIDLMSTVLKAYNTSFQRTAASGVR